MTPYDRACAYQFALFLEEGQGIADDELLKAVPDLITRRVEDAKSFGLKFADVAVEQFVHVDPFGAGRPGQGLTWRGASGIWRLTCAPSRVDVVFEARAYADILESDSLVPVGAIASRIAVNLAGVPSLLGRGATRCALVVSTQTTLPEIQKGTVAVARSFLNEELNKLALSGDLVDTVGRTNLPARWHLAEHEAVAVNRMELGSANLVLTPDGSEHGVLAWQLDVNTSPSHVFNEGLSAAAIVSFFKQAEYWISERMAGVERLIQ
jgi:hypothetical protein